MKFKSYSNQSLNVKKADKGEDKKGREKATENIRGNGGDAKERGCSTRERGRKRFLMLIYECLTVVSWNKWLVGVARALLPVQDTKCIVRSAIRPNLHM